MREYGRELQSIWKEIVSVMQQPALDAASVQTYVSSEEKYHSSVFLIFFWLIQILQGQRTVLVVLLLLGSIGSFDERVISSGLVRIHWPFAGRRI